MPDSRTPLDAMLDALDWTKVEYAPETPVDGLPRVTHEGVLEIAGLRLNVVMLDDGRRVIPAEDMERFLDWLAGEA
jgi:hypothetical protein